jgi:hypothetical protein
LGYTRRPCFKKEKRKKIMDSSLWWLTLIISAPWEDGSSFLANLCKKVRETLLKNKPGLVAHSGNSIYAEGIGRRILVQV